MMKKLLLSLLLLGTISQYYSQCAFNFNNVSGCTYYYSYQTTGTPHVVFNFGDGTQDTITSGNYSGFHTFPSSGTYVVTLDENWSTCGSSKTVTADCSSTSTNNCGLVVTPNDRGNCLVDFTASNLPISAGAQPYWDFLDGTTATGNPVSHAYSGSGWHYYLVSYDTCQVYLDSINLNCTTTNINEQTLENSLKVYPNPTSNDIIYFELNATENSTKSLTIVNAIGQEIIRKETTIISGKNTQTINISSLAKGIYTLNLNNKGTTISRKFIVQ